MTEPLKFSIPAKELQVGDFLRLDCGYNGMIDMKLCQVVRRYESTALFSDKMEEGATVVICGSLEHFDTSFSPDQVIADVQRKLKQPRRSRKS